MTDIQERLNEIRKTEQKLKDLNFMFAVDLHGMTWTDITEKTKDMVDKDFVFVKGAFDEMIV